MEKNVKYKLKSLKKNQFDIVNSLRETGLPDLMSKLYVLRGVDNFNQVNLVQKLESFNHMKGAREAAKILARAILKKEKICIIADYDVDGATACAVALRGLRMFGALVDYVVPDRFIHGYGLTPSVVDEAINRKNPDLIITVDNGISSFDGVARAKEKGVRVLITDHHLPGEKLPEAECIVNPNQPGCQFSSKSLAGCGVMFYVLSALRDYMIEIDVYETKTAPNVFSLLDLVAIGTIADVVKLDLNNRIMVKIGLEKIRSGKTKAGILSLIEVSKRKKEQLSTSDVAFAIGPRINAAGRLEDMTIGINCLMTDNKDTADKLASKLNEINKSRRELESDMKEEALDMPSLSDGEFGKVAFSENFHEGVIGIVASRIKDLYYLPTIVFAPSSEEGLIKGSGRSIAEIHLRDVLDYVHKKNDGIIVKFGGHAMAAGLTIRKDKLDDFNKLFQEAISFFSEGKKFFNLKTIDLTLSNDEITIENAELVRDEVWGQGFEYPLFSGQFNVIDQKLLKGEHLKLKLELNGSIFDGIWFFNNVLIEKETVNIAYNLGVNEFLGNKTVQIMVEGLVEE